MKVIVLEHTKIRSCVCISWLTYWEKCSGLRAVSCFEKNCRRFDVVGTQVKKINDDSDTRYIIPLCTRHCKSNKPISVPIFGQVVEWTENITEYNKQDRHEVYQFIGNQGVHFKKGSL